MLLTLPRDKFKRELRNYPHENPPLRPTTATGVAVKYLVDEVDRRVEERVEKEIAATRAEQAQTEKAFLSRSQQEQDVAAFLMGFGRQHEQDNGDALLTLVRAASVSFSFGFFPVLLCSALERDPQHPEVAWGAG
jgi:hypothetical protein